MSSAVVSDTAERGMVAGAGGLLGTIRTLVRYKEWANAITFRTVLGLPEGEALKPRATRFGNIVHTLNHVFVVDDIFRHHLTGRRHGYTARNTAAPLPLAELWARVQEMDAWYVAEADALDDRRAAEVVPFEYVGGGEGAMTRADILLHLVNHATYHRGFVGDMLYQVPVTPTANDFTVYLRDHHDRP